MISRMWNTFLDTTPRQWGQELRALLAELNPRHFFNFNIRAPENRWIAASIVLHVAFVFSIIAPGGLADTLSKSDAYEIEFLPVARMESDDVEAVFDDSSEIVVAVPKKKKEKPLTFAERMLKKYKRLHVNGVASVEKERADKKLDWRFSKSHRPEPTSTEQVDLSKHLDAAAQLDSKNQIPGLSKDQLNQHLAKYSGKFQSCYESALLKDESLNGKVHFELKTGSTGNITSSKVVFEGVGLPATRGELQNCLQGMIREISFPSTLAAAYNRTVQFQAVLSM